MRQAYLYSATLHIAVITIAYLGVPTLFSTPPIQDVPVTVDLVSLEEVVKPKKQVKPAPQPVKKPPPPPAAPPEPPEPVAAPAPEPPPPPPSVKPEPKPKPEPKHVEKAKLAPKPVPKPPVKPARAEPPPKPKPKPEKVDSMQALLKDLAKRKEELERQQKAEAQAEPASEPATPKPFAISAINQRLQAQRLTAMVKEQVAPCWSIPGGVEDVHEITVDVQIRLNTDGTLRGAPRVLDAARMRTDRSFRVIAESAVRALQNPRCRLKLPYDQYELWKDITFNFDPGEALGQ